jgi:glutamine synthetase
VSHGSPTGDALQQRIAAHGIQMIDFKFTDLLGTWQHFTIPASAYDPDMLREGLGFDGSSIRGFQPINESDMLLLPDPTTAAVDPACSVPTLSVIGDVVDPVSGRAYSRDPRRVLRAAEQYLRDTGIADTAYFGPEIEFHLFSDVRYGADHRSAFYSLDTPEAFWNSAAEPAGGNKGYTLRPKQGYFPTPPADRLQDVRSEIVLALEAAGVPVELHHHEVGASGQCEIDIRYATPLAIADRCMMYKHVVRNVALRHGLTASFMPKPIVGDNGSGMHVHQSLWKNGTNLFFDERGYALLSDTARWYIGGLIAHAPALLALAAPTTNSYRRLVPGFEAPVNLVYSQRNRSACVRIPMYSTSPKSKRIEFRCPDPAANPYLCFAALLMAGIDGIQRRIEPPAPVDKDIYELPPAELAEIKSVPGSLQEALAALEADHDFLLQGGVFTEDLIAAHIAWKREHELAPLAMRPHPYEFYLYGDV